MIYFIQTKESGKIKIGYSTSPDKRIKDLQIANPEKLELIGLLKGSKDYEKQIHQKFEELNIHGEWFDPGNKLLEFIHKHAKLPDKNVICKISQDEYQLIFPGQVKFTKGIYFDIGSYNLKILTDKEFIFIFGVEGKRDTLLSWINNHDGIDEDVIEEIKSLMN